MNSHPGFVMPKPMLADMKPNRSKDNTAFGRLRDDYWISAIQLVKLRKENALLDSQIWKVIPFDSDFYQLVKNEVQSLLSDCYGGKKTLTLQETRFVSHQLLQLEPVAERLLVVHAETVKNLPDSAPAGFDEFKGTLVSSSSHSFNVIFRECGFYLNYDQIDRAQDKFRVGLFKTPKVFQLPPTYFAILLEGGSENILHNSSIKEKVGAFYHFLESDALIFDASGRERANHIQFNINHEIQHRIILAISFRTGKIVSPLDHEYASYLAALMYSAPDYAKTKLDYWSFVYDSTGPSSVHAQAIRLIIKNIEKRASRNCLDITGFEITAFARKLLDKFYAERFGEFHADGHGITFTDFENWCVEKHE